MTWFSISKSNLGNLFPFHCQPYSLSHVSSRSFSVHGPKLPIIACRLFPWPWHASRHPAPINQTYCSYTTGLIRILPSHAVRNKNIVSAGASPTLSNRRWLVKLVLTSHLFAWREARRGNLERNHSAFRAAPLRLLHAGFRLSGVGGAACHWWGSFEAEGSLLLDESNPRTDELKERNLQAIN